MAMFVKREGALHGHEAQSVVGGCTPEHMRIHTPVSSE
jgi:hypothetical protein